jgi:hypothetical protein
MPADNFDKGLIQTATRMLDMAVSEGAGYDHLINVLSLLCILSILNRNQPVVQQTSVPAPGNPLQKLIGELTKGEAGGPSPDALMSLLPMLNSPQLKSKLNPTTIAAVMGLLNNMGGSGGEKHETKTEKPEKSEKPEKPPTKPDPPENKNDLPAAAIMTSDTIPEKLEEVHNDQDKRHPGRFLNWKSSF